MYFSKMAFRVGLSQRFHNFSVFAPRASLTFRSFQSFFSTVFLKTAGFFSIIVKILAVIPLEFRFSLSNVALADVALVDFRVSWLLSRVDWSGRASMASSMVQNGRRSSFLEFQ